MSRRKTKKILSLLLAFAMVVTESNATFRTVAAAETSDTAGKDLPLSEEDGYAAYMLFTDKDWAWGNWGTSSDSGWGNDAIITGDGTYTVSIDREGYKKYLEENEIAGSTGTTPGSIKAANGAQCFMVDFKEMATAQNFDISNMKVKDVTIKCDGKVFPSDTSKMYFGDIESKNNLRLEIRNEYGYGEGDFETRYVFDPNGEFTFSDSLSVTFTLEGIQKGNSPEGLFYDFSDGKKIVRTLEQWNLDGGNFVPTAKPKEQPGEEHTGGPYKAAVGFQVSSTYDFRDGYEYQEASEKYNVWLREQGEEVPDYNDLNIYLNGNGSELYQKGDLKGTLKKPEKVELYREAVITDAVMEKDGDYTVSIKNLKAIRN